MTETQFVEAVGFSNVLRERALKLAMFCRLRAPAVLEARWLRFWFRPASTSACCW